MQEGNENKTKPIAEAIAMYPFQAQQNQHLNFQKNESLLLFQLHESGWWLGKNEKGTIGLFPSNFVRIKKWISEEAKKVCRFLIVDNSIEIHSMKMGD